MAKKRGRPRRKLDNLVFSNRVANRIVDLMKKEGLTGEQLYERMTEGGFVGSRETVRKWLSGHNRIDINALPVFAKALDCTTRVLIPKDK